MFVEDSKTRIHIISPNDTSTPLQKLVTRIPSGGSTATFKRSSAPCRPVESPLFDTKNGNSDSSPPVLPVRRHSEQYSEAVKGLPLELKSSFLPVLLQHDETIQDDFDDLDSTGSSVSDITNPTTLRSFQRSDSTYSIDTYSTEIEYHRPSSSSGRKDLPPRPVARQLTASSQDSFHPSVENNPALSPPMTSPPPRPFATEKKNPVESQELRTTPERDEVLDNDTPPVPLLRRLTERSDQIFTDSSTKDSIQEQRIERHQSSSLIKLAIAFLENVAVSTNYHLLKKYENSFVGRDAVDFMLESGFTCTREDAVFLGQRLQREFNLFYHVSWDHSFTDGNYLYRFTDTTDKCMSKYPKISSLDLFNVADVFERDIRVASHFHYFVKYKSTFVGSEAVDYLVRSGLAHDRKHAVFLGQQLLEDLNLFHHVAHSHQFKDANRLYRFSRRRDCGSCSTSSTSDDASSTSLGSLIMALQKKSKGTTARDINQTLVEVSSSQRGIPLRSNLRLTKSTESKHGGSSRRAVTFGSVDERVYERTLEMHPSTRAGPSILSA